MIDAEKTLLIAAVGYSRSNNVSLTKISWALASIMGKQEHTIYHNLKEIDNSLDAKLKEIYGVSKLSADIADEHDFIEDDRLEDRVGDIVTVEVVSIKTFGAICRVENSTRTLLLHLSEVADEFIADLSQHLKVGDKRKAMLIINPKWELGLSLRQARSKGPTN